jgi:membrane protein implicated in regulation of membrane protease activity
MEFFRLAFIALTVFGAGVTAVDLFGVFEHVGQDHGSGGDSGHDAGHGADHDTGHDAGHAVDHDAGHDAYHDAGQDSGHGVDHDMGHDSGHEGDHDSSHDAYHDAGHDSGHDHSGSHDISHHHHDIARADAHGSLLDASNKKIKYIGRAISTLRTAVYFSLGAGPMGWIAMARGEGLVESILWAAISGFLIAVLARVLRRVVRKDLDSSLKASDFVAESAEVVVPIEAGKIGKVRVRKYGREQDVYARMEVGSANKGDTVRVVDYDQECYLVVKADYDGAKIGE